LHALGGTLVFTPKPFPPVRSNGPVGKLSIVDWERFVLSVYDQIIRPVPGYLSITGSPGEKTPVLVTTVSLIVFKSLILKTLYLF